MAEARDARDVVERDRRAVPVVERPVVERPVLREPRGRPGRPARRGRRLPVVDARLPTLDARLDEAARLALRRPVRLVAPVVVAPAARLAAPRRPATRLRRTPPRWAVVEVLLEALELERPRELRRRPRPTRDAALT